MRVLVFIRQRSFARYVTVDLADAARRLGWDVHWLDLEGLLLAHADDPPAAKQRVVADALAAIERFDPDLVFSYGLEYLDRVFAAFLPAMTETLHDLLRRPAVYCFFDFGFPFDRPPDPTTRPYLEALQGWDSLVLCWDRAALETLHAYGVRKAEHFPMAVNPSMFFPDPGDGHAIPVVFLGGPTDDRIRALEPLAPLGLQIYGYDAAGWTASLPLRACYAGELLERDRARTVYSRARVSVNVTRPHGSSSLNMRVYEAMACGSLMVTDDKGDARELFQPDEELVIYRDPSELAARVEWALRDEEGRRRIADEGMRRVRESHTYEARLRSVAPRIEQALRESRLGAKLHDFMAVDAPKALRFVRYLEAERLVSGNTDNLKIAEARLQLAAGHQAAATAALDTALKINPSHTGAIRLRETQA